MEARNRGLPEWFARIQTGQVRLPRFQRFEAWGHDKVAGLIESVLRGLPAGATLILEIGDQEPFKSRTMRRAPEPTERAAEHVLDGQQRLTALWSAFNGLYEERTYFVRTEPDEDHPGTTIERVYGQSRWLRGGKRYPLWADDPAAVHARGFLPLELLRPGDCARENQAWCSEAVAGDFEAIFNLFQHVNALREKVAAFNLPFLSLPVATPRDVALDVFVKMNTNAAPLTPFDIVVALVEEETGRSLHDLVAEMESAETRVRAYGTPHDLVLRTAALREDRSATQASFGRLNLTRLVDEWQAVVEGIRFAISFVESEGILDAARLPTSTVLPVLAAMHDFVPGALDGRGNAMTLLRKYVWRAFASGRYENQAATRQLQDFRGLRAALTGVEPSTLVPVFDEEEFPVPGVDQLLRAGWPKGRDILARTILAVALRGGALDLADGQHVSRDHLRSREYHHLFPAALLRDDGRLPRADRNRALNCALITWNTNRNISAKEPLRYLRDRVERSTLGEAEIRARLATHAVPFDPLNVGDYSSIQDAEARARQVSSDYAGFLRARAVLVEGALRRLCNGENWTGAAVEA